ncbi:sigma 54-interacting transcriptional regulator [Lacrimispora sp.]|uniref:sigma 54-interacting transcriptional regulator n=1 Tax=Lacrimispora sp. TaxID=2719234 RepID=UPI00345FD03C
MSNSPSNHALIVAINPVIRVEFQAYLHSVLGKYISFDTIDLFQVRTSSQIAGYQCILFSSEKVQSLFPFSIPQEITQLVCSRTFNHAFLDQIIQIPPNERVYLVNDTLESIPPLMEQLKEAGITQYHFLPCYPGFQEIDESIQYAITLGEPQLVPEHIKNVVNIGNRIIDISTINELCYLFHLPSSLSNRITQGYVNRILQIAKLTGTYYSNYVHSSQLLQTVFQNLPIGICLVGRDGKISTMNRQFFTDLGVPETDSKDRKLSSFLPSPYKSLDFFQNADYRAENKNGEPLELSSLDISLPNHAPLCLVTSKKTFPVPKEKEPGMENLENGTEALPSSAYGFSSILTASLQVKSTLEYARRLALYDFPVLIQGETGTQKKMIAFAIHKASNRRQQPLVFLHSFSLMPEKECPARQLEAFLGTIKGGTLVIDRAEHLSLDIQDLLLDALQAGGRENVSSPLSDLRIITICGHDLYEEVLKGSFRKELFFYLNTVSLDTLPLRKRPDDIPLLMEYFFQNLIHSPNLLLKDMFSPNLMEFLLNYDYPGNIQELRNLIRFFLTSYSAHPLILSKLPSYIKKDFKKPLDEQSAVRHSVLTVISSSPRIGRSTIREVLEKQGCHLSDGRLRGLLKELSEEGLIQVNRTRGGCEITELGMAIL